MRHRLKQGGVFALLLMLCACAGEQTQLTPVTYSELPNWQQDDPRAPLKIFVDSCNAVAQRPTPYTTDEGDAVGDAEGWRANCSTATRLLANPTLEATSARQFFEDHFTPYHVSSEAGEQGHMTGYYEPLIQGSLAREGDYQTPVYGVPDDLPASGEYFTRAQIEGGAITEHAPVLLYVNDPVMLFFLQIQGSGKVQMPDGSLMSLQYAAQNHQPYVAIGKVLRDEGALETVSMQTIRDWLQQHPERAAEIMQQNPSYVFFKLVPGDENPKGALQLPLTPLRSVAIDHQRAAYGVPMYIATTQPDVKTRQPIPLAQLFVAQDTGGALHGSNRIDIFFGRSEIAEWQAGQEDALGDVYWLLPNKPAPSVPAVPQAPVIPKDYDPDLAQAAIRAIQ